MAIVLRRGSDAEMGSVIDDPQIGLIKAMPGVKKEDNAPIGAGEVVVVIALEKFGAEGVTNVQVRGVTDASRTIRPGIQVVEGRAPSPGTDEVMVGRAIRGRMRGVELGQSFDLKKNRPVQVVGVFTDNGSSHESEVWMDVDNLRSAFGREGAVSSVRVVLESPASFDAFEAAVESDKRLGLDATRETKFYEKQSEGTSIFLTAMGAMIAVFFSLGAMIGATITMYASIANRQREIGTLRALGFSRLSILLCFLLEAVVISVGGGLVGALLALAMGTVELSMINFASWSELVFRFRATPEILVTSVVAAVVMGLVGGFLPAVRAARTSPLAAMRA